MSITTPRSDDRLLTLPVRFAAMALCVFSTACVGGVKQIPAGDFVDYGDTPLEHTVYLGSDAGFHYFAWSRGLRGGRWKVLKTEMRFRCEWPVQPNRDSMLLKDQNGDWQPYRCK